MGGLAAKKPDQSTRVSGILVKRNFNYHIMAPADLPEYTDLTVSSVTQRLSIAYNAPLSLLMHYLTQLSGDVEYVEINEKPGLRIFGKVTIIHEPTKNMVMLEVCMWLCLYKYSVTISFLFFFPQTWAEHSAFNTIIVYSTVLFISSKAVKMQSRYQ